MCGSGHAGSGSQAAQSSLHQRRPASSSAAIARSLGPDRGDLVRRPAAALDPGLQLLVVLPVPRAVRFDHDVELEILRVEADRAAPERLLDVHVPAGKLAPRALPEDPDGVHLAGLLQLQDTVPAPRVPAAPRDAGRRRSPPAGTGAGRLRACRARAGRRCRRRRCRPSRRRAGRARRRGGRSARRAAVRSSPHGRSCALRRRHAPERAGLGRGALPAHRNGTRREAVRADPGRRRLDRRDVGRGRGPARRRPARPRRPLQAQLRPAPGHARRPRARPRRDRRDDGRRPPERAGGHPAPRRGGRGGRRRRQRPARRPQGLVGAHAALAADQRDAPALHGRRDLRLRLRLQRLPPQRRRAGAAGDREAEVHEGARPLRRRVGRRGRRRARRPRRPLELLAAAPAAAGAARPRRLLAAADPVDRDRARRRLHAARDRARRSTGSGSGSTARTSPARCSAASPSSSCSGSRASSSRSSGNT